MLTRYAEEGDESLISNLILRNEEYGASEDWIVEVCRDLVDDENQNTTTKITRRWLLLESSDDSENDLVGFIL
jgi:deoxyhypusine synthase